LVGYVELVSAALRAVGGGVGRTVESDIVILRLQDEEEQRCDRVSDKSTQLARSRSRSMSESTAIATPCVDRIEYDWSLLHVPVTGPPRYAAAAIKSTLHPNLLSQAFARSSPLPLA
jgi:hypothetical protein